MPNRLIKESICTSDKINALSDFHFRLWAHLITYVDDYGRGDARPAIIKGRCFPLRDDVDASDIAFGLEELANNGCIRLYQVNGEPFLCFPNWNLHQTIRNKKSKYPEPPADDGNLKAIESNCNQLKSDESKCYRNPIQSESESESESSSESNGFMDDDDARQIQKDHDRVLNAAEDAGFKMSNDVRANLINLYEEHGLQKTLDGLKACSEHGALNLAYLRAVLKGEKKPAKTGRVLPAQDFQQRDYSGVQKQLEEEQKQHVIEMLCKNNGLWDGINNKPVEGWREKLDRMKDQGVS